MLKQHSFAFTALQRALDVLAVAFGMMFATWIHNVPLSTDYLLVLCLAILLFLFFVEVKGVYRSWRTGKMMDELANIFGVWFLVAGCLVILGFATKTSSDYSRVTMVVWGIAVPIMLGLLRLVYRVFLRIIRAEGRNTRSLAFIGCGKAAQRMNSQIIEAPWMGLQVIGVFDDRSLDRLDLGDLSFGGNAQRLLDLVHLGEIDVVYITLPMHAEKRIIRLLERLADTTASVYVVPDIFLFDLFKAKWSVVAGLAVVNLFESPFYGVDGWVKRVEDIVIGSLILVLISPLLLLIGLAVKLTSSGPVLFKQRRYGLKGEVIDVWKFRSMTACDNGATVIQAQKNDVRITPFGRFLRCTSLDELPQFINVLQGTMSIVGPRPHAVAHNEEYRGLISGYMLRHSVKPGITGWAQVNGWRGETEVLEKMQGRVDCDMDYVRNWSLWLDIKIIFMTVYKGFVGKTTY